MTREQILKKVIEKAVKNGWKWGETIFDDLFGEDGTWSEYARYAFIFDHDFAKALWEEENDDLLEYPEDILSAWEYHLQQLVISEDRIKYLEKFI